MMGYDGLDVETAHVKPSMDPIIWSITTWILEHWSVNGIYIYSWVNYNDLTATPLDSWLIREIIPKWP